MNCANEKCDKSSDTLDRILLNQDGDFACSQKCADEYKKQRDHFFNVTVHNEALTEEYLRGRLMY